ncbi:ABC transporter ATPase [Pedobacter yulinensis]|uniref:ABC transporter ATPase n=1 Tax=Pedobacter yulinensis TaxID=2126353 RepID=A0A2T3HGU8_9SPHI|nr:ABC transporter ATPase [Pedobacter yulinensis]PST81668.1 ABC transporter ATPase [Pedobacter yulinensis]
MPFSPQSRVWVYQSNRRLNDQEARDIQDKLNEFAATWKAHERQLLARAEVRYNFFIILVADENQAPVTGCSIDTSVRLIKEIEQQYGIDLFDRFNIAYKHEGQVIVNSKEDFETLVNIGQVSEDTVVFNNMVQTLEELETKWELPFSESWHAVVFSKK